MFARNAFSSCAIEADPASLIQQRCVHRDPKKTLNFRLCPMVTQIKNVGKQCIRQLCLWGGPRFSNNVCRTSKHVHVHILQAIIVLVLKAIPRIECAKCDEFQFSLEFDAEGGRQCSLWSINNTIQYTVDPSV